MNIFDDVFKDHPFVQQMIIICKRKKSEEDLEIFKQVKEKTLLDDFEIQEVETTKESKTFVQKRNRTNKYEKISLEDILKEDNF